MPGLTSRRPGLRLALCESTVIGAALTNEAQDSLNSKSADITSHVSRLHSIIINDRNITKSDGPFEVVAPRVRGDFVNLRTCWSLSKGGNETLVVRSTAYSSSSGGSLFAVSQFTDSNTSMRYGDMRPCVLHVFKGLTAEATNGDLSLAHVMGLPPRRRYERVQLHNVYEHHRAGGLWGHPSFSARSSPDATIATRLGLRNPSTSAQGIRSSPMVAVLGISGHLVMLEPDIGALIFMDPTNFSAVLSLPLPRPEESSASKNIGCWCMSQSLGDIFIVWHSESRVVYAIELNLNASSARTTAIRAPYALGTTASTILSGDSSSLRQAKYVWQVSSSSPSLQPVQPLLEIVVQLGSIASVQWTSSSKRDRDSHSQVPVCPVSLIGDCLHISAAQNDVRVLRKLNVFDVLPGDRDRDHMPPVVGLHDTNDAHSGVIITRADGHVFVVQHDAAALLQQARIWGRVVGVPVDAEAGVALPSSTVNQHSIAYVDKYGHVLPAHTGSNTSKSPPDPKSPKHGEVDSANTPHVGGNNWAGGSGGSDTAGLGGRGGPYRLDSGHPVAQVSDEDKANISTETRALAKRMAKVWRVSTGMTRLREHVLFFCLFAGCSCRAAC